MARALLEVVFTDRALLLCNATGKNWARERRTMLYQDGMRAIYSFVKYYSKKKTNWLPGNKWTETLHKKMKTSVGKKINELRNGETVSTDRKRAKRGNWIFIMIVSLLAP